MPSRSQEDTGEDQAQSPVKRIFYSRITSSTGWTLISEVGTFKPTEESQRLSPNLPEANITLHK